ncbi:MAG: hypothetical protein AYL32_003980 [Candidatus Bathyarchaeota archaeon B26-2]|nr:MAG: hypothetical protein AYL32_003980 [Candidatus Bathyarchaeota archaeon B26-2]
MRDVSQGRLLFALSVVTMIVYFWAVFMAPRDVVDPILGRTIGEWAIIIPVLIFVYLFLFVVAWIGWTMATTPPPLPVKGKVSIPEETREGDEEREEEEG